MADVRVESGQVFLRVNFSQVETRFGHACKCLQVFPQEEQPAKDSKGVHVHVSGAILVEAAVSDARRLFDCGMPPGIPEDSRGLHSITARLLDI